MDAKIVYHVLVLGAKLHASCVQGAAVMAKLGKVMAEFNSDIMFARLRYNSVENYLISATSLHRDIMTGLQTLICFTC